MPVTPTYPGVYVEEVPSGVRTITGVATSIAAFLGRALRGPTDKAVTINSYGDFARSFGGLWVGSSLGYAVRDFYLNGGSQAIIVRLYHAETGDDAKPAKSVLAFDGIQLEAAYEGKWGANLRASIDVDVSEDVAKGMNLEKKDIFNLTLRDVGPGGFTERFINLSVKDGPRRIDKILTAGSKLMHWQGGWPSTIPQISKIDDAHTKAKALQDLLLAPTPDPDAIAAARTALANALRLLVDPVTIAEMELADAEKVLLDLQRSGTATPEQIQAAKDTVKTKNDDLAQAKQDREDAVSDGDFLTFNDFLPDNAESEKKGVFALEQADLFNLLCIPPYLASGDVDVSLISMAATYCERRRAMLLIDPPSNWTDKETAIEKFTATNEDHVGTRSKNAALFFPRLRQSNPLRDNQMEDFAPCGTVAGVFARTDTQRGVWKAPAGLDATLVGVPQLSVLLTNEENGQLNPLGINCLRALPPAGRIIWGARTLQGDDRLASEWKYIPVRRMALFLEESLYRGLKWVVFEPNDEPLWAQIRLNVGAFMRNLFRQGAFQGTTPSEAYFVKCDKETTTQNDINLGIVNILVGFAPLKPAEFVVIKIQQMTGQVEA